jgi:hypothetical protein
MRGRNELIVKKVSISLVIVLLLAGAGFVIWASDAQGPSKQALADMQGGNGVVVENQAGWTVFRPQDGQPTVGLIFYPGGRVDYRSYAPLLSQIAAKGYEVVLVPMPLNLAIFGVEKAGDVMAAFPSVKAWAIGGHSVGGSMAAQYVINHPGSVQGLVFWASYPPSSMVALTGLKISLVSGSKDGLATPATIESSHSLLPASTTYVVIEGGNHGQFGSYGSQSGDNPATIDPSVQWQQTVDATVNLLGSLVK